MILWLLLKLPEVAMGWGGVRTRGAQAWFAAHWP